ncbi:hypothetical protein CEXT_686771 [Caerostris extrusa]|uniref:Uncharacterized protein n=1 Tax=Caerostris extrusa TaxID=172846 RepID=A0AAV4W3Z8_CAEEX|nr:hypothetical protein CEXT_686771 [Caerostris extrusa]
MKNENTRKLPEMRRLNGNCDNMRKVSRIDCQTGRGEFSGFLYMKCKCGAVIPKYYPYRLFPLRITYQWSFDGKRVEHEKKIYMCACDCIGIPY